MNQKKKFKSKRKSKYVAGGMYQDNVIPSAKGSTAMTVYNEDNPAIQAQREQALKNSTDKARQESSTLADNLEAEKKEFELKANENEINSDNKFNSALGASEKFADSRSTEKPLRSAINTFKEARQAKKTMQGVEAFNSGKAFMDSQAIAKDGIQSFNAAKGLNSAKTAYEGANQAKTLTMSGLKTADQVKNAGAFGTATLGKGAELSTSIGAGGNMAASTGTQVLAKGSAVGKGLKNFATSGAGIGTIASLAGMGISKFSDDGDATHSNVGEYTGSIMSAAGTGATVGSIVPGIGTAIGAGVGALFGAGKQFFGTRKAKKLERAQERKREQRVGEYNKDTSEEVMNSLNVAKMGSQVAKNYTGFNLGNDTVAKLGGYRNMPKYV